ncbi:hypothetical protein L1887_25273 [Cichorium endivia]|nr:hypothetical protein L1887_25273 [Cichorium endivia]
MLPLRHNRSFLLARQRKKTCSLECRSNLCQKSSRYRESRNWSIAHQKFTSCFNSRFFCFIIESKHDELRAKFFEKRAALEAKFQKLYAPLYSKRYDTVNGIIEVDGVNDEAPMDVADDKAKEEKGVPSFWLNAMRTNEILVEEREMKKLSNI